MSKFYTYRLYRRAYKAIQVDGNAADGFEKDFTPTQITFRARSDQEAMKKANKFWQDGSFGAGSITVTKEH